MAFKPELLLAVLLCLAGGQHSLSADTPSLDRALPATWETILSTAAPPVSSTHVWRSLDNAAFRPGENLSFVIKWGMVTGGFADMIVLGPDRVGGRSAYHLISETHSAGIVENFYHVDDRHDIWVDTQAIVTLRFDKHVQEGKYQLLEHCILNHLRSWYVINAYRFDRDSYEHSEGALPENCLDVLGALYYVRTLPLAVGSTYTCDVLSGGKIYPLVVKVKRREKVKVPAGEFDCLVVQPILRSHDVFVSKGKKLEVWLTDDARHMPVRMRSVVVIGHVSAELLSHRQEPPVR